MMRNLLEEMNDPLRRAYCGVIPSTNYMNLETFDGRFVVSYSFDGQLRIFDLFHMKEKRVDWDWTPVLNELKARGRTPERIFVCGVTFVTENTVIAALMDNVVGGIDVFTTRITLDYEKLVAVIHSLYPNEYLLNFEKLYKNDREIAGRTFMTGTPNAYVRRQIEDDDQLQFVKKFDLPTNFHLVGIVDSHLYGFCSLSEGKKDMSQLVQISLESKQQTTLKIDCSAVDIGDDSNSYDCNVWVGRTFILSQGYENSSKTRFFALNLNSLKWWNINLEIPRSLNPKMRFRTDDENVLVLQESPHLWDTTSTFYRFVINRPDSLATLSWLSIRRNAHRFPAIDDFARTHLPKNSPLHCPFYVADE